MEVKASTRVWRSMTLVIHKVFLEDCLPRLGAGRRLGARRLKGVCGLPKMSIWLVLVNPFFIKRRSVLVRKCQRPGGPRLEHAVALSLIRTVDWHFAALVLSLYPDLLRSFSIPSFPPL